MPLHDDNNSTDNQFVIRRVISNKVVVGSDHPILGTIYWVFSDNSDCNAPNHYGLTNLINAASRLESEWRKDPWHRFRNFTSLVDGYDYEYDETAENPDNSILVLTDALLSMAELAKQTHKDFLTWWKKADWSDRAAPDKSYYLEDINGFLGYKCQWTEYASQAMRLSQSSIETWDDEEPMKLASLGEVITYSDAISGNNVTI